MRNWNCSFFDVFELEQLECRSDVLRHGEVDVVVVHGNLHSEVVERTFGAEPFSFFALETVVEELEDSVDVFFVTINQTVVHVEK